MGIENRTPLAMLWASIGVPGLGWDMIGVQDLAQTGRRGNACWHCGRHHVLLQHVVPVQAHPMRCRSDVCGIDQDGGAKKAFNQVGGVLHGPSATFTGVSVFQEVDHRGCLPLLEEGDNVDHVKEVLEAGVINPLPCASFAKALALPRRA